MVEIHQPQTHQIIIVPGGPIQLILAQDLRVDSSYQPLYRAANIEDLVAEFDPNALGFIDVSFRDGQYYVVDGQRRMTAAKEVGYKLPLLCHVRYGLDRRGEAALWKSLNNMKPQHAISHFKTMVVAGMSPAVQIQRALEVQGFMVDYAYTATAISTVRGLEHLYLWGSLPMVLATIRRAWQGNVNSTKPNVLMALGAFDRVYREYYEESDLADALRAYDPGYLEQRGLTRRRQHTGPGYIGTNKWATLGIILQEVYNQAINKLDPRLKLPPFRQPKLLNEELVITKPQPGRSKKKA